MNQNTTMTETLTPFDAAHRLDDEQSIAYFMSEAFQTGDAAYIAHAIGTAARAKSMMQVARESGLSREHLYRSFSERGNPTLRSLLAVMQTLGLRLAVQPIQQTA